MKCPLLLALFTIFAASCNSQESRIQKAIGAELAATLFDYDSYQPIETQIDSLYSDRYGDTLVYDKVHVIKDLLYYFNQAVQEHQQAQNEFDSLSRAKAEPREVLEAGTKANEWQIQSTQYLDSLRTNIHKLADVAKDLKGDFYGWRVTHTFKCKRHDGNEAVATYIFFMSEDGKKIYRYIDDEQSNWEDYKTLVDELLSQ